MSLRRVLAMSAAAGPLAVVIALAGAAAPSTAADDGSAGGASMTIVVEIPARAEQPAVVAPEPVVTPSAAAVPAPPGGALPATGVDGSTLAPWALAALAACGVGAVLGLTARRRRASRAGASRHPEHHAA